MCQGTRFMANTRILETRARMWLIIQVDTIQVLQRDHIIIDHFGLSSLLTGPFCWYSFFYAPFPSPSPFPFPFPFPSSFPSSFPFLSLFPSLLLFPSPFSSFS
ncbi:hypothetical protein L208DRAFT_1548561, partial [Tricholoma matsutake]